MVRKKKTAKNLLYNMMFVSREYKFVFLHPMKTGGTTMRRRLRAARLRNSGARHRDWSQNVRESMNKKQIWHIYHLTWELWMTELCPELLEYRKVTFVRNPYDRFYSFYLQFWNNIMALLPEAKPYKLQPEGFFKPVSRWYDHPEFKRGEIRYVNTPQVDYTHTRKDDGAMVRHVDFIGRLENYETDLDRISDKLGIKEKLGRRNRHRPKCNVRNTVPENNGYKYLHHYDQETLDFVNGSWADDLEYLKYRKVERVEDIPQIRNMYPYLEELKDLPDRSFEN